MEATHMKLRTAARLSIGMGILSLLALGAAHLALTDIAHGEADVSLEWRVLQISAAVILAFQVVALATLRQVARG
jgi:hypothetical protein